MEKDIEPDYYQINNSKKVLYWTGTCWAKPIKDNRGKLGSYVCGLDNQPKNVKTIKPVSETEYAHLYKPY